MLWPWQDVTEEMGPTLVWGGTHTAEFHAMAADEKACLLDQMQPHVAVMEQGEALLYNSLLFHCGGENASQTRRTVMSVSFTHPEASLEGTTDSLLAQYQGKLRVGALSKGMHMMT